MKWGIYCTFFIFWHHLEVILRISWSESNHLRGYSKNSWLFFWLGFVFFCCCCCCFDFLWECSGREHLHHQLKIVVLVRVTFLFVIKKSITIWILNDYDFFDRLDGYKKSVTRFGSFALEILKVLGSGFMFWKM